MTKFRCGAVLACAVATVSALAVSPVGTWKGKIYVKTPPMGPNATPQQKELVKKVLDNLAKTQIVLTIKADKTFSAIASGPAVKGASKAHTGKWTQKGTTLTMIDNTPGARPQVFLMDSKGTSFSYTTPDGRNRVVFSK